MVGLCLSVPQFETIQGVLSTAFKMSLSSEVKCLADIDCNEYEDCTDFVFYLSDFRCHSLIFGNILLAKFFLQLTDIIWSILYLQRKTGLKDLHFLEDVMLL